MIFMVGSEQGKVICKFFEEGNTVSCLVNGIMFWRVDGARDLYACDVPIENVEFR